MKVIVIGSGMAGLTAATELRSAGADAVVVDKGRVPGGRMSTRDVGDARFDHGAQHFSARTDAFSRRLAGWLDDGVASVWYRGRSRTRADAATEPRHVGTGGMRSIPVHLAAELDVRQSITVEHVAVDDAGVVVHTDGERVTGDALVVTPPVPQTASLLAASGVAVPDGISTMLAAVDYDASLTVMATLDRPTGLDDGHLAPADGPAAWIADNQHKGVSAVPSLTIQSTPDFAEAHLDADPTAWVPLLVEAALLHVDAHVVDAIGHRWRYSQPRTTFDTGAVRFDAPAPVVLAGEAFAGAKVEGAFTSGLAAAQLLVG